LSEAIQLVYDASADPVLAIDDEGRVVFANASARRRWPTIAPSTSAHDLFSPEVQTELARAVAAARTGATARFEWGDPASTWFLASVHPVGDVVVCTSIDITAHKRAEERLRRTEALMVDTQGVAHLGVWEWDVGQPNATWSAELYRIYGLTPETYTPSYEAYLQMVHPDDRQRVADATGRVFHEHIPYSHDERIFRPDGSIRHLHTWAHPVLDEHGKLRALIGVCQDITDQKLAEEQTRQLNVELERRVAERTQTIASSLRDLEAFSAMVSHDLRAPLHVIQLVTAVLQNEAPTTPAQVRENVGRIQHATAQMASIVDDLLRLARVGHATIERTDVDLSRVAIEVLAELRLAQPQRALDARIEPQLRVVADPGLMRSVLTNLIGNAWKYSAREESTVIEVGAHEAEGRREIFVRDNGAGFDMTQAHRLFQPFERLHRADDFEGTGVGLTIVQRIIERHGGQIRAESEPGAGATFYFTVE
jgi:PAS domain S-box-containing protein